MEQLTGEKMNKLDEDLLDNFPKEKKINSISYIKEELKRENNMINTLFKDNNVNIHYYD